MAARREQDDAPLGRCEAEAIVARVVATDPYAAWLERRDAERLRERPEIRWVVHQYPRSAGTFGGAIGRGTREAPAVGGDGSREDGLVTAA